MRRNVEIQATAVLVLLLGAPWRLTAFQQPSGRTRRSIISNMAESDATAVAEAFPKQQTKNDSESSTVNNPLDSTNGLEAATSTPAVDRVMDQDDQDLSIFEIVAGRAASCLLESDLRRDAKAEYSNVVSSSATNWINDATAFALQKTIDRLKLKVYTFPAGSFGLPFQVLIVCSCISS